MHSTFIKIARVAVTLIAVLVAVAIAYRMWIRYEVDPWTRDGRVRAEIVQIAPDVSGLVTEVRVRDNQLVHAGDILFIVDKPRYHLALAQAQASIANVRAQLAQAKREVQRNRALGELASTEVQEQSKARLEQLEASLTQAIAAFDTAQLNFTRTEVKAPVNGMVSNLNLHPGDYASTGRPILAIIDQESLHVVGYFEETKLSRIHVGDPVRVQLMGEEQAIDGQVESIAGGIEDRERSASSNLLANVNPTFSWVRLAQRIPVRIKLQSVPQNIRLIMGRTASVEVLPTKSTAGKGGKS